MSKKVKTSDGVGKAVLVTKPSKTAVEVVANELDLLRGQQVDCEQLVVRGRKVLNALQQGQSAENNVAELIIERLGGLDGNGKNQEVVVETIVSALTNDWQKENGRFVCWFLKLTANLTYEKTSATLWCEDSVWPVFLCVARFLTATKEVERRGKKLAQCLEREAKDDCSASDIEWENMVKEFLDALDGDPFIANFVVE